MRDNNGDSEFDRGIAVQLGSPGEFTADLGAGWTIGEGLNGGYLLAVLGNAAAQLTTAGGHPDPFAVSAHYLTPTRPGPALVRAHVVRAGRSLSTVQATLFQEHDEAEVPRITAVATYGDLGSLTDEVRTTAAPPDLPARDRCFSSADASGVLDTSPPPVMDRFELCSDPASAGWAIGKPSGRGLLQGWFRFSDGRDLDPLALLFAVDALPPVTFDLGMPGWAPTVELTVHVRARPAPGWARLRHRTANLAGGYLEEDCEVWDSAGRLVAQSRQLARAPRG